MQIFRLAVHRGRRRNCKNGVRVADLVVQNLRSRVGVFRMPVHAIDTAIVGDFVNSFDQRTTDVPAAALRIDEQIFEIAVAGWTDQVDR